jgi:hypothetical protein
VACTGEGRDADMVLVGKSEGRILGRPKHQWEDNSKMDFHEIGGRVDWIDLAQYRDKWWCLVNKIIHRRVA